MADENSGKEKIEQEAKEKQQSTPWWKNLHPMVLIGAVIFAVFIIQSIIVDKEGASKYMIWLIAGFIALYLMSQMPEKRESTMVLPEEAEYLVEKTLERKKEWGQIPMMSECEVSWVSGLQHRDGGGVYYNVGFTIKDPYLGDEDGIATVMAKGEERGFVTCQKGIGQMTGSEVVNERTIIPPELRAAEKHGILEHLFFNKR